MRTQNCVFSAEYCIYHGSALGQNECNSNSKYKYDVDAGSFANLRATSKE